MKRFNFATEFETDDFGTVYVHAEGTISDYIPATMYRSNGDPGDPAEGGEVEYDELDVTDDDGNQVDWEPDYSELDDLAYENAY